MKTLLALALMVALLAIGNTAAACPLGVCMGDPFEPAFIGWDAYGYGIGSREYKGSLPFRFVIIRGTRKSGACESKVLIENRDFNDMRARLRRKYGRPSSSKPKFYQWVLSENPDKIVKITLEVDKLGWRQLEYRFENYHECEKAKEARRKDEEAKSRRMDAEL